MIGALTCSKVLKNGAMWKLLHKWDLKLCQRIIQLDDFVGKRLKFSKQTEYIDSLHGKPCLPYFGAFLNAFTNLGESPNLLPATDQLNLDKMSGLSKVQGKITLCQANLSHPPTQTKTDILQYIQSTELELSDSINFSTKVIEHSE